MVNSISVSVENNGRTYVPPNVLFVRPNTTLVLGHGWTKHSSVYIYGYTDI